VEGSDTPPSAEEPRATPPAERAGEIVGKYVAVPLLVVLILALPAVVVLAIIFSYPSELPDRGFLDSIFANEVVLWVARLVVLFAGAVLVLGGTYLIVSIGSWIKNSQWLTKLGPLEVSQKAVDEIREEAEVWRSLLDSAEEEIDQLKERLEESDSLIEALYGRVQDQDAEIEGLKPRQERS
jgi:hypothetical protein